MHEWNLITGSFCASVTYIRIGVVKR